LTFRSALALLLVAVASTALAEDVVCPSGGLDLKPGVEVIEAYRTYTGADGNSHVEKVEVKGFTGRYFNNTAVLTQFDLGDPSKVVIVYGHPNIEIPQHPAPYKEKFLIIAGSSTMFFPDGTKLEMKPGTLFLSEDTSGTGRSGRAGPCGYIAVDIQYKDKE
jgi:opacity protein-like surface antigen